AEARNTKVRKLEILGRRVAIPGDLTGASHLLGDDHHELATTQDVGDEPGVGGRRLAAAVGMVAKPVREALLAALRADSAAEEPFDLFELGMLQLHVQRARGDGA